MPGNIPAEKKDYKILNACLCGASYLDLDFKACGAGEGECLCCADDYVCMGTLPDKPQLFGMYGLICYPVVGCCKPLSHFYPEEQALESKKDRIVFGGCCLGPPCVPHGAAHALPHGGPDVLRLRRGVRVPPRRHDPEGLRGLRPVVLPEDGLLRAGRRGLRGLDGGRLQGSRRPGGLRDDRALGAPPPPIRRRQSGAVPTQTRRPGARRGPAPRRPSRNLQLRVVR